MSTTALLASVSHLISTIEEMNSHQGSIHLSSLLSVLETAKSHIETTLLSTDVLERSICMQGFVTVLDRYLKQTAHLVSTWHAGKRTSRDELTILTAKLLAIMEMFTPAAEVDPEDLFMKPESDPSWQRLRQITEVLYPEDEQLMREKINSFASKVALGNVILERGNQCRDKYMKKLVVGSSAVYFFFCRDAAVQQARLNHANADVETAKALWNMVDSRLVSSLYQSLIIPIHLNSVIYLPRVAPHILSNLCEENEDVANHSGKHYIEQLQEEPLQSMVAYTEKTDPSKVRIPVRVLSPFDLPMAYATPRSWWCTCCNDVLTTNKALKQVILHFHGGGFIAMSSASHQNYTRKWAVETDTPVLSVDYRLAPESKYPNALDDCWQAYVWVVKHAKKYLGISPERLVLAGDSAGGNLALGVVLRCIHTGEKIPSGLLLTYPCVNMDAQSYTPSLMMSLEDPMIPYSFMKLCIESYLSPTDNPKTDPYISPILISHSDLAQFPPVRIMTVSQDPILDHSIRFAEKLIEAGVNVKLAQFEGLPHGSLNLDQSLGVSDARKLVEKGTEYLKELLEG